MKDRIRAVQESAKNIGVAERQSAVEDVEGRGVIMLVHRKDEARHS
jgi:hypothetical protein